MSISKTKRQVVIGKSSGKCVYCGVIVDLSDQCLDHIIPKAKGGANNIENLVLSCRSCNSIKRTNTIEHFRLAMRIKKSKFNGIINVNQYVSLLELGVSISLPDHLFYFEVS